MSKENTTPNNTTIKETTPNDMPIYVDKETIGNETIRLSFSIRVF
jgi:hypothetical protein